MNINNGTEIQWSEVVEHTKTPYERRMESLINTIIKSLSVGTLSLCLGIGALIFIAYNLNTQGLDAGIGKIFSGIIVLSIIITVIFFSKAYKAWNEKNLI